jgi:transcription elongation factor Elf1
MSRAISGTQDLKGRVTIKAAEGGMERIRCPSCQGIAVPSLDAQTGTKVIACGKCGRSYTTRPM